MFGLELGKSTNVYWGARAIYDAVGEFSFLPDRQSVKHDNAPKEDVDNFFKWLNKKALPNLRKQLKDLYVTKDSGEVIEIKEARYVLRASPNKSYGYLYIGAGELQGEQK